MIKDQQESDNKNQPGQNATGDNTSSLKLLTGTLKAELDKELKATTGLMKKKPKYDATKAGDKAKALQVVSLNQLYKIIDGIKNPSKKDKSENQNEIIQTAINKLQTLRDAHNMVKEDALSTAAKGGGRTKKKNKNKNKNNNNKKNKGTTMKTMKKKKKIILIKK